MLSQTLKRALSESPLQLPPTFLLPWAAGLSTAATTPIPRPHQSPLHLRSSRLNATETDTRTKKGTGPSTGTLSSCTKHLSTTSQKSPPAGELELPPPKSLSSASPVELSSTVRELLPLVRAQGQFYATLHIHGKPYLVTQGDTVRLPFRMQGVEPGDVLRLNRAINLGSRDFTIKAPASSPKLRSPTTSSTTILDPTSDSLASYSQTMPEGLLSPNQSHLHAPHFIPHIAKGKHSFVDDRLFVCRALVMGVESEPMRFKEKTKRRQRHVRTVKSKHRYTILKIKELSIKSVEDVESEAE